LGRRGRRPGAWRLVPGRYRSTWEGKGGSQEPGEALESLPFSQVQPGREGRRTGARRLAHKEGAGSCPSPLGGKELGDVPKSSPFLRVHLGKERKEARSLETSPWFPKYGSCQAPGEPRALRRSQGAPFFKVSPWEKGKGGQEPGDAPKGKGLAREGRGGGQEPGEALDLLPFSRFHLGKKGKEARSQETHPRGRGWQGRGEEEARSQERLWIYSLFLGFTLGRRERRPGARRGKRIARAQHGVRLSGPGTGQRQALPAIKSRVRKNAFS
jgi:hypothetical protein